LECTPWGGQVGGPENRLTEPGFRRESPWLSAAHIRSSSSARSCRSFWAESRPRACRIGRCGRSNANRQSHAEGMTAAILAAERGVKARIPKCRRPITNAPRLTTGFSPRASPSAGLRVRTGLRHPEKRPNGSSRRARPRATRRSRRDHWEKNQEVAPLDSLDAVSVKWGPDDVEDGEYDEHVSNRQAEVEKRNTQADSRIEVESIPTRLKQSGIRKWGGTWRRAGVVGCSFSWTRAKRQPR
jgi:hypothetical protein